MQELEKIISDAFDGRAQGFDDRPLVEAAVGDAIAMLDSGDARVAEKTSDGWHVNQWLKKAVLLSFALSDNHVIEGGHSRFYDKVPLKYADYSERAIRSDWRARCARRDRAPRRLCCSGCRVDAELT